MIVYRVMTAQDTLAGNPGKVVPNLEAALIVAREMADSSRIEAVIYKYDTATQGIEIVTTVYAHPSVRRNAEQARHAENMRKQRDEQERKRRQHEKFLREQAWRYQEYVKKMNGGSSRPVQKTKMDVAMSNLGLKVGFDHATLKTQYRIMAKKYHPDTGGKAEHFQWITKSYKYILESKGWK